MNALLGQVVDLQIASMQVLNDCLEIVTNSLVFITTSPEFRELLHLFLFSIKENSIFFYQPYKFILNP